MEQILEICYKNGCSKLLIKWGKLTKTHKAFCISGFRNTRLMGKIRTVGVSTDFGTKLFQRKKNPATITATGS